MMRIDLALTDDQLARLDRFRGNRATSVATPTG